MEWVGKAKLTVVQVLAQGHAVKMKAKFREQLWIGLDYVMH